MRTRVSVICGIIIIICVLLLLRRTHESHPKQQEIVQNVANGENRRVASSFADKVEGTHSSNAETGRALETFGKLPVSGKSNDIDPAYLQAWQAPIDFYGKVVDEQGNPVSGASVHISWMEKPTYDGERKAILSSDADGLFSINGKVGSSLEVSVTKKGYYASRRDTDTFHYGIMGNFTPVVFNPVVFHLKRKKTGETLVEHNFPPGMGQIWQLHHDGTPIDLDLVKGVQAPAGNGQLRLVLLRDLSNPNAKIFDWKLQLSAESGGLLQTDEEFAFTAPQTGYQPSIVIDMPATNQNWQSEVRSKYCIKLPNGDFGEFDLYFLAYNGVFTVHSEVNPTGSRNLEPQ